MRNRILVKSIVLVIAACGALGLFAFRTPQNSKAEADVILKEISTYKTWTKVNQKPIDAELESAAAAEGG
jgi:hypothetical protein